MNHLYKISEFAEILQVSYKTAKKVVDQGSIPVLRLGPRTVRIKETDIQDFINQQCQSDQGVSPTLLTSRSDRSELEELLGVTGKKPAALKVVSAKNS